LLESPGLALLLRDLNAFGHAEIDGSPAADRLTASLGEDLLNAVLTELNRLDTDSVPTRSRPHRAA